MFVFLVSNIYVQVSHYTHRQYRLEAQFIEITKIHNT